MDQVDLLKEIVSLKSWDLKKFQSVFLPNKPGSKILAPYGLSLIKEYPNFIWSDETLHCQLYCYIEMEDYDDTKGLIRESCIDLFYLSELKEHLLPKQFWILADSIENNDIHKLIDMAIYYSDKERIKMYLSKLSKKELKEYSEYQNSLVLQAYYEISGFDFLKESDSVWFHTMMSVIFEKNGMKVNEKHITLSSRRFYLNCYDDESMVKLLNSGYISLTEELFLKYKSNLNISRLIKNQCRVVIEDNSICKKKLLYLLLKEKFDQ